MREKRLVKSTNIVEFKLLDVAGFYLIFVAKVHVSICSAEGPRSKELDSLPKWTLETHSKGLPEAMENGGSLEPIIF